MCFRLYAATSASGPLETWAFQAGLDFTLLSEAEGVRRFELARGDCACALRTQRRTGRWLGALARRIQAAGGHLDLLLVDEDAVYTFTAGDPRPLPLEVLEASGLAALPEGHVVRIVV